MTGTETPHGGGTPGNTGARSPHTHHPQRQVPMWRTGWFRFLTIGMTVAGLFFFASPDVYQKLSTIPELASVVAIVVGIRRNRPASSAPWWILAAAGAALVLGTFMALGYFLVTHQALPSPSVVDIVYLAPVPLYSVGVAMLVRRLMRHSQWEGALDAAIVTLGLGAISWVYLVAPQLDSGHLGGMALAVSVAYPLGMLLVLAMAARLVFTIKIRTPSFLLLIGSLVTMLFANSWYQYTIAHGGPTIGDSVSWASWLLAVTVLGAAALHPSMVHTAQLAEVRPSGASPTRLALFAVLGLLAPTLALINIRIQSTIEGVVFLAVCSSAMLVLLIVRLGQIAQLAQERAADLGRSRGDLRRAHERVTAMFESAPTGMAQLDATGRILAVNSSLSVFTGMPVTHLVDASIAEFVDPDDLSLVMDLLAETLHDRDGAHSAEIRCVHPDGDPRFADLVASPVRGSDDSDAVIVVIADRTHARRLEMELRHSQKLEGLGLLAAGVAHEINTPIQFIGDNVNFLGDTTTRLLGAYQAATRPGVDHDVLSALDAELEIDYLTDEIPEAVRQTIDGVHRVATIVQALRSFAHPPTPIHEPSNLNQSLTDTLTVARNELVNVTEIRTNLGDLPPVTCSVGDLNQVFLNLLLNAADAVADTPHATITLTSRTEGDDVVIDIIDNGTGIPPELQEKIFEPFFTTKPIGQGTGQGLALARTLIVDRHHGTITCTSTSTPNTTTTFTIRLPINGPTQPTPHTTKATTNA
jgi:PAS domain S-box-containing protein